MIPANLIFRNRDGKKWTKLTSSDFALRRVPVFFTLVAMQCAASAICSAGNPDGQMAAGFPAVSFTENKGQVCDQNLKPRNDVFFGGFAEGLAFHLRNQGISYQLSRISKWVEATGAEGYYLRNCLGRAKMDAVQTEIYRVDINWKNCNAACEISTGSPLPGYQNFYHAACPSGVSDVGSFAEVTYKNLYPQIDLHFYGSERSLKYDFVVRPGADYRRIRLEIGGVERVVMNDDGSLELVTPAGSINEGKPVVYQNGNVLPARWIVEGNELSFQVENYDRSALMIIDPAVRAWGTYFGGTGDDIASACVADANGDLFVTGETTTPSGTIFATSGAHQATLGGSIDAYLAKFSSSGQRLWSTYYGGSGLDRAMGVALDGSGNPYIAGGTSSSNAIATAGAYQTSPGQGFLAKFNTNGIRQWGTFYPGGLSKPTIDNSGNIFVSGSTQVNTGVASGSAHQVNNGGNFDGFLVKFSSSGARLWATFYGGAAIDFIHDCAVDASGNVYITGRADSNSPAIFVTTGAHQSTYGGGNSDAFVAKFNGNGVRQWSTYYGGSDVDQAWSCAVSGQGDIYVVGRTLSANASAIATSGSHQPSLSFGSDAFIVCFSNSGVRTWGTYYGGSSLDGANDCAVTTNGLYVCGSTGSNNNLASAGGYQTSASGAAAWLAKFSLTGARIAGTFYGGSNSDNGFGCASYGTNEVYLCGHTTNSTGSMASSGAFQTSHGGGSTIMYQDAFIAKFLSCKFENMVNTTPASGLTICSDRSATLSVAGPGPVTWHAGSNTVTPVGTGSTLVTSALAAGSFTFLAQFTSSCGVSDPLPVTVSVQPSPTVAVNSGSICSGKSFTLSPSGAVSFTVSGGNSVVSPPATTTYSVFGTAANGCQNLHPALSTVSVFSTPVLTVNSGTVCPGKPFLIVPGGADYYAVSGNSFAVWPTTLSAFTVTGVTQNGCYGTPVVSTVDVFPPTVVQATSNRPTICAGESATLTASGGQTYWWSENGITLPTVVVSPANTTTYTVLATDANNCSVTSTVVQIVDNCVGIANQESLLPGLLIFPNPGNGVINFQATVPVNITVYDNLGRMVARTPLMGNFHAIDLSHLAPGLYLVNAGAQSERLVIQ